MNVFVVAALVALLALTALNLALIAGAPLGRFAWGGQHVVLPRRLRFGAVVAVILYAVFAGFLLSKAGTIDLLDDPVLTVGMWVITVYAFLSAVPNALSRSRAERFAATPLSLVLGASYLAVTLGS